MMRKKEIPDFNMDINVTRTDLEVLKALAYILDIEESEKLCHSWRVAVMAKALAQVKCEDSALKLYIAGLLHDMGTFDISNRMVHYRRHFEVSTVPEVRTHPQKSAAIACGLSGFIPVARVILDHHEWINGKGYPRGLKGEQISLESQILRIADKFAFLLDTEKDIELMDLKSLLGSKIGNEFSKDLYDNLVEVIKQEKMWGALLEVEKLEKLTDKIFIQLPVADDESLDIDKRLIAFFGRLLDTKHSYTQGHSMRVSYFSVIIALAMGLSAELVERIETAAFLHDIGKIGIPKSILDKKGRLTIEEFEIVKKHATFSREIIERIPGLGRLSYVLGTDQEHWDGSGYPWNLKKKEIPIEARIILVADAFDAMTSIRSYHKAIPVPRALEELKKSAETDLDPEVVKTAVKVLEGFKNPSIAACYVESA